MEDGISYLILLLLSPLVAFCLHFLLIRVARFFSHEISPLPVALFAVLCGLPVVGWGSWEIYLKDLVDFQERFWGVLYALLVYGGLAFSYFQTFAMTETARRIRILRELYSRGRVTLRELESEYSGANMLAVRLERMVALNQLTQRQDRYWVKGRLLLGVGKIMEVWARLLKF